MKAIEQYFPVCFFVFFVFLYTFSVMELLLLLLLLFYEKNCGVKEWQTSPFEPISKSGHATLITDVATAAFSATEAAYTDSPHTGLLSLTSLIVTLMVANE